jgi:hypothetical protein
MNIFDYYYIRLSFGVKKMKKIISFVFISVLFFYNSSISQEIIAVVNCNVEQVPTVNKDYLIGFDKRIENYINNYRWIGKNYGEDRIKVNITIVFFAATSDNIYNAKVVLESQRPIYDGEKKSGRLAKMFRALDDKWEFSFQRDQSLDHDELRFDALCSFIDFYMYIILGYDTDTYEKELAGSPIFERARKICQMGAGSAKSTGWKKTTGGSYGRWDLIEELLSPTFTPVRKAFLNYHYNGLDLKSTDPENAYKNAIKAIEDIGAIKKKLNSGSIIIRNFFDLRHQEIGDFFKDYPDKTVYRKLSMIDNSHYKTYEDYYK